MICANAAYRFSVLPRLLLGGSTTRRTFRWRSARYGCGMQQLKRIDPHYPVAMPAPSRKRCMLSEETGLEPPPMSFKSAVDGHTVHSFTYISRMSSPEVHNNQGRSTESDSATDTTSFRKSRVTNTSMDEPAFSFDNG